MAQRARTPNTPFIPPLLTPGSNESPPPVIPSAPRTPNYGATPLPPQGTYVYPASQYFASPYIPTGFIPAGAELSEAGSPPVIPGATPISRGGPPVVSQDYTGYPGGQPPMSPPAGAHIPMYAPQYGQHTPASAPPHFANFPGTPWAPPAAMAPNWGRPPAAAASAWGVPPAPMSSPYGPPPPLASPWHTAYQTFTPAAGLGARLPPTGPPPQAQGPPPGAWGQPPQQHSGYYGQPPHSASFFHHDPAAAAWAQAQAQQQQYSYFGAPQPPQPTREPPGQQNADRMPIFSTGPHYGPVLEPFIVRALQIELKLNPLISPPGDDPSAHAYLKWNMLFPTSTVQRTDDKHHMSWMDGRDAPATFPRVTVLHLVSEHFPWMFTVSERVPDRGVTCGEVIDAIGAELSKLTTGADYSGLSKPDQGAVSLAYNHNRSRNPGVPGGALGKGLRRLDFLKRNVNFAGIEVNNKMVWRLLGEMFPCTFVLKSEPFTRREAEEQDLTRLRPGSSQGGRSRSRAGSMKISVHSPSDKSHSDNDSLDNDR